MDDIIKRDERYYEYMVRRSREEDKVNYMENKVNRTIWANPLEKKVSKYPAAF